MPAAKNTSAKKAAIQRARSAKRPTSASPTPPARPASSHAFSWNLNTVFIRE